MSVDGCRGLRRRHLAIPHAQCTMDHLEIRRGLPSHPAQPILPGGRGGDPVGVAQGIRTRTDSIFRRNQMD